MHLKNKRRLTGLSFKKNIQFNRVNFIMAADLKITKDVTIGCNSNCFIIAEIGQNHQGDIETAQKLIKAAKQSGADCVKLQKTSLKDKFTESALSRIYTSPHSWGLTYGEHKRHLEFTLKQFYELQTFANETGIMFTASAMDLQSLDFLCTMKIPFIKIGSGDNNNYPLIHFAASKHIPLIISTGMQTLQMVKKTYDIVSSYHKKFCLLHCISAYPTPVEDINLKVLKTYSEEFPDVHFGYSGHELGITVSIAAVSLGARVIERHLTLDKNAKGSDHCCSLLPLEFKSMVDGIRSVEIALGSPTKQIQRSEESCLLKLGKSLVLSIDLTRDHKLRESDLNVKVAEPKGIDCSKFYDVVGKVLNKDKKKDESLMECDLI